MTVTGAPGQIPDGTTIAAINSPTQLTLSGNATAAASLLTFTGMDLTYAQHTGTFALDMNNQYTVINGVNTSETHRRDDGCRRLDPAE